MKKHEALIKQFERATMRLEEILQEEKNLANRDSSIKRFELAFDLSWKLVKEWLFDEKGLTCTSPKDCFRIAYKQGAIKKDSYWLDLTDKRNLSVHTYDEELADAIYAKLPEALSQFKDLLSSIKKPNHQVDL